MSSYIIIVEEGCNLFSTWPNKVTLNLPDITSDLSDLLFTLLATRCHMSNKLIMIIPKTQKLQESQNEASLFTQGFKEGVGKVLGTWAILDFK